MLDSVGVGALPDADEYGDKGTNTIAHIAQEVGSLQIPHLAAMGLSRIVDGIFVQNDSQISGCYGKMMEASKGKDSTTGHWEIAGIITERAFPLYPSGFPKSLLDLFLRVSGCNGYLGNKPASGTEIIQELGDEHVRTGFPIIYTSGDSVFQIAAHQEVIPLERLYEMCQKTRDLAVIGEHRVGRVIARPFIGSNGSFTRTPYRRDYAIEPPAKTVLDILFENGIETVGIGKIDDLYCGRGLRQKLHTKSNAEGVEKIISMGKEMENGLMMANLVDFDMLYGHRQDAVGYGKALEEFDAQLPEIQQTLSYGDMLILTADHGNDPTDASTDHTREYVPVLSYTKSGKKGVNLGVRNTLADVGKTVADFFDVTSTSLSGKSFLTEII